MFTKGQKIKTSTGKRLVVMCQLDNIVYTYGGGWYHITKVWLA